MRFTKNPSAEVVERVRDIPFDFEEKALLHFLEEVNPCGQRYHHDGRNLIVTYRLRVNLLQFIRRWALTAKVRIVGLPLSVARKGYFGEAAGVTALVRRLPGFTLVLNGPGDLDLPKGHTLSTFELDLPFASFEGYLQALRSGYRRRCRKALEKRKALRVYPLAPADFDGALHALYEKVHGASSAKLEHLPLAYFQGMDGEITVFEEQETGRRVGFIQTCQVGDRLYFLFAGLDKEEAGAADLYLNLLLEVVRLGIAGGAAVIDFGQTAEESKLRLGCREVPLFLQAHHGNALLNRALRLLLPRVSYRPFQKRFHVFKEHYENHT